MSNEAENKPLQQPLVSGSLPDDKLLEYYNLGWNDCADGKTGKKIEEPLLQRAYKIGRCDFIAGDDVSSVDLQTNEDIIRHIRQ